LRAGGRQARGIERRKIFWDDTDRSSFLERLAVILEETQTQCYAWALIPNHFHILLRTGPTPLSKVMRRLMTGYAVTFNRRHRRAGHLFQNRYKSVVCEEDPYLLELIRYIHLNPLRAGHRKNPLIPKGFPSADLPASPESKGWRAGGGLSFSLSSGKGKQKHPDHPVKLARAKLQAKPCPVKNKSLSEKTVEDVLKHFGETFKIARRKYRQFVKNGIDQGKRPEFQGGGLVRSAGGNKAGLFGRRKEEREKGDERILGSGNFVNEALMKAGEDWEKGKKRKIPLAQLIGKVASHLGLKEASIISSSRKRGISEARGIICYLAVNDMGYSVSEVAHALEVRRVSAGQCVTRGEKILLCRETTFVKYDQKAFLR
jgi:REP element-mobilizing transposase RayT